jgi:Flp pilus assembly protein TadD
MDAQSNAPPPRAKVFWLVWLSAVALAAGTFIFLWQFGPLAVKAQVFRQTAHGWKPLPPLGSLGYDIRISDGGVVWVQTTSGLSRLDGPAWRRFGASDFGTEHGFLFGDFALDGEDVWGAAYDGVVHFDGKRWRHYPNTDATGRGESVVASHGNAWLVDRNGNLAFFDGSAWTGRKLDLPGVRWSRSAGIPKLAVTSNGALWLAYQGLWRNDGTAWTRISGATGKAALLGVTPPGSYLANEKTVATRGGVWVFDEGAVVGFDIDGAPKVRYKMRDLGLDESTRILGVAGREPILALATSQGAVWFDGNRWHAEQLMRLGIARTTSIAVAPDGSVWGIGYPPAAAPLRFYGIAMLASLLFLIIAIVYPIWWWKRKARYQRQATREAVLHATGSVPEDLQGPEPSGLKTAAGVAVVLALSVGSFWMVKRHWPDAPVWLLPAFWLAIHIIATVMGSLKKRKPLPSDPIGPGGPPRYDWAQSLPAVLGGLAVIVLLYGGSIARHFHVRWLAAVPGIAFLCGGQFLFRAFDTFRAHRVEREIKRCRYEKALEMLDGPLGWLSTGLCKFIRSDALFFSGRAQEAEKILRGLVEVERGATRKTLAFENLGRVLLAQGRYGDAQRAFEAAVKLMPARSAAYAGLAELRLLQGTDVAQALVDSQRALQLHRDSLVERKGARERLAIIRGNQAWALALLGRSAESQQAIEAGAREMDPKYTPEVAGFYWRAGMAMLATENSTAAVGHLRRAVELDPEGHYGRLAAKHLSEHSVWGAVGIAGSRYTPPGSPYR